jgi:ABC-type glycerol-3-phosphate transport system substrate-binding protein
MLLRRITRSLVIVLVLGLLASAAAQVTEVRVWFGRQNFIPTDAFETFHAENPDIRVNFEVVRLEDVATQLILAQRAGQAPDIVQIASHTVPQLASSGMLRESSDLIERWRTEDPESYEALAPITWSAASYDGGSYGASLFNQSMYLFYRQDWLAEAGINEVPRNSDEVLAAARAMSTLQTGGDRIGFSIIGTANVPPVWELPLFLSLGGTYVDGVPQIDSEAGRAFIDFYQTLVRERSAHPDSLAWDPGEMRAAVIGGRAGMMIEGEHIYVPVHAQMPYEEGKWSFTLLPHRPGAEGEATYVTFGFPYVVTAGTQKTDAVLAVLEYLSRVDMLMDVALTYQPASNLLITDDPRYAEAKPWADEVVPLFERVVPLPAHPTSQLQIMDVLVELRQDMIANPNDDPAEKARRYQQLLNEAVR